MFKSFSFFSLFISVYLFPFKNCLIAKQKWLHGLNADNSVHIQTVMVMGLQKSVTLLKIFDKTKFLCHEDPSQVSSTPWWQWLNSSGDAVCTKGILEGVCGRLNWFLPSLLFFHCFPNADSETWWNNLIPWWQMQMKQDRYLDPVCVYGEDDYIIATEWNSDFQMQGFYLSSTHRKHADDREEKDKCAKYRCLSRCAWECHRLQEATTE